LRFLDPKNSEQLFSSKAYDDWMPVDLYIGGSEHAVLHLLYARFWHKVLYDEGVVKHPEPFIKLVHQGKVLGRLYRFYVVLDAAGNVLRAVSGDAKVERGAELGSSRLAETGEPVEVRFTPDAAWRDGQPYHAEHGVALGIVNEKMSKSRGNVVNPDDVIAEFGADSLRLYEMFMGPLQADKPWQTAGMQGVYRFLDRVHGLAARVDAGVELDIETRKLMHRTIKKVRADIEGLHFNTVVSTLMIYSNHLVGLAALPREAFETLVLCLAPLAPHLAEDLWHGLGHSDSITGAAWPEHDEALCVDDSVEVPLQVNGKVRGRVVLAKDATQDDARAAALADRGVQASLEGKKIVKVIYVAGRVLNLVVK
jgi:leucyl-tRNA synthetase